MAMDKDVLGNALAQVIIDAASVPLSSAIEDKVRQFWKNIAEEIITHIQERALVTVSDGKTGTIE